MRQKSDVEVMAMVSPIEIVAYRQVLLVYGISTRRAAGTVARTTKLKENDIHAISAAGLTAVVRPLPRSYRLGSVEDLRGYRSVLGSVMRHNAILPLRFGSVVDGQEQITEILTDRKQEFTDSLSRISGQSQMLLRMRYVHDAVMREIISSNALIRRMQRAKPAPAGDTKARLQLGRLVAAELAARREHDFDTVLSVLTSHVTGYVRRAHRGVGDLADLAVLVPTRQRSQFEADVAWACSSLRGRVRFHLDGPMAPFDFAQVG